MSASNGQQIVIPSYHQRSVAELSSQERSRLLDALIAQHNRMGQAIEAQGRQITALTHVTDEQLRREKEYNALTGDLAQRVSGIELDHAEFSARLRASFLARLRWVFRGR